MNSIQKIKIFLRTRHVFKNWLIFPSIYFKTSKKSYAVFETTNDFKLKIRTNSTDIMTLTNVWLMNEYDKKFEIKENDVVIDIGAHIGLFSLFASQYCKNGKIFSYEPIKENFELFLENIDLNQLQNIHAFNSAVSKTDGKVRIFYNEDEAGHSIFGDNEEGVSVNSVSLQKIFDDNEIAHCNFLKIDCEGAEYEIIDTLPDEYFDKIDKIVIEYHFADSKPELSKKLISRLKKMKFETYLPPHYDNMGILYAKK